MSGTGKFFKNPGVPTKVIFSGLIITALFVGTTFLWLIPSAEKALIGKKKEKIREATEIAWSILESYHLQEAAGTLTREAARKAAATMVEQVRFGPEMKDYFWINDTLPRIVMHPYRTDLNGQDVTDFRDPNGKAVFVAFADVAMRHGEGFVDYLWQWQDDNEKIVPKISFVRLFRPWGWVLGTGMYIEDVRSEIGRWKVGIIVLYSVLALTGMILSGLVGKQVAQALRLSRGLLPLAGGGRDDDRDTGEFAVSLRTYILAIMIPLLLGLTVFWSFELYRQLYNIILEGFDARLYGVSSTTGIFIPGTDHAVIEQHLSEDDPMYQKYVVPMRTVRDRTGLTYLYTQTLVDRSSNCVYLLDATPGEEHSEIGTRDELEPTDYNAALKVMLHGVVHISDVDHTENWGMLKYAYAPIWNADGTVRAIAGADVNIDAIRLKTRTALFSVFVMALLALVLGAYLSLLISNSLTRPIAQLKRWALSVAAGSYGETIAISHPLELKILADDFGQVGNTMDGTMKTLRRDYRHIEESELTYRLTLLLDGRHRDDIARTGPGGRHDLGIRNRTGAGKTGSGACAGPDGTVFWIARPSATPLEAVRLRSDVYTAVERLVREGETAAVTAVRLYQDRLLAAAYCPFADGSVHLFTAGRITYLVCTETGMAEARHAMAREQLTAGPGQALLFWDSDMLPFTLPAEPMAVDAVLARLSAAAGKDNIQIFTGVIHGTDAD